MVRGKTADIEDRERDTEGIKEVILKECVGVKCITREGCALSVREPCVSLCLPLNRPGRVMQF